MLMTLAKACDLARYDQKKLIDDRTLLRRDMEADFITPPAMGRLTLDVDDAAALILYADLRKLGQPVKFAGLFASRIRGAMRDFLDADQLTTVTLENGSTFTLPSALLDLSSGYGSGGYIVTATLVDVRNLRDRVRRALNIYEPEGEAHDG